CRPNQFQCSNGDCIDGNLRCNRRNECSDGSDEYNCPTQRPPFVTEQPPPPRPPTPQPVTCSPGYQPCYSGDRCILRSQLCDGRVDCNDMSDETNCPSTSDGGCTRGQFRCENGPCIGEQLRCDGKVDCPRDSSDELDCPFTGPPRYPGPSDGLNLKTYPNAQEIKENREVVFQCRDEGPLRARVRWTRPNGEPLPPGSRDLNGRLEMPNIKVEHSGTYICEAVGYPPSTPGGQVSVHLQVDRWIPPPTRPPTACGLHEATCSNGDCIPKNLVCDGRYDCPDGSDENRCNPNGCEPNEYRCANKKCILKTWRCDSDDDCGDGSDEENCATNPPGSLCAYHQFACHSNNQCIPRSYHCDLERDCIDGTLPVVSKPPPPMVTLEVGSVFEITCTAVGVPTPEIVWRLNWGHIPSKCRTSSVDGFGTLTCPDIQIEDQGAYSCEVINIKGTVFAVPDTILVVKRDSVVCREGYFNEEARTEADCIKCFCFGQSTKCRSADLFIYQFQPPFDTLRLLGVRVDPVTGVVEIRDEPIYRNAQPQLTAIGRNGVYSQLPPYAEVASNNLVPYFAMPENYHGNQLKSYGGYLRFSVRHYNRGYALPGPTIILTGNGYTLLSQQPHSPQPNRDENIQVRFFAGEWVKRVEGYPETIASREEIMMTLADIDNILIKLQYNDGPLNTTISNIEMDSAAAPNSGLGPASFVEECECPVGYTGTSCERCADGYVRHKNGPWLGQCYRIQPPPQNCPAGTYGDPSRGRPCEICPCPLTNPSNQYDSRELAAWRQMVMSPAIVHRLTSGDVVNNALLVIPEIHLFQEIHAGLLLTATLMVQQPKIREDVVARIMSMDQLVPPVSQIPSTSAEITNSAVSHVSVWVSPDNISTVFTSSRNNFKLIDTENRESPVEEGINLNQNNREIVYSSFANPNVHYWSLPSRYLGNKITSYGGYLRYTLRYVPLPGGQSSRNSAADVELISANQINLLYYAREPVQPTGTPQTFVVPLLEQYWQRSDGQRADREHLLMALADLEAIYIKATYNTNTRETALISVSLDIANEYNTGSSERALAVEQCQCPEGYKGLSCEDCDVGYTRADEGIYLGLCERCNCNGYSNECDPETGACFVSCLTTITAIILPLEKVAKDVFPDMWVIQLMEFRADTLVVRYHVIAIHVDQFLANVIMEYPNVEGNSCDRCRVGTFGLDAANIDGCQVCFCAGVATECTQGNFYYEQIPTDILDAGHGFTLTDELQRQRIDRDFIINPLMNEIGYTFRPSDSNTWYWSLPRKYTGNQIRSYGGQLEFTQRYTQRPQAGYIRNKDVIIIGNGVTIYWYNPQAQSPGVANKVSVILNTNANWQRLDSYQGPRPASREDILTVLANIDSERDSPVIRKVLTLATLPWTQLLSKARLSHNHLQLKLKSVGVLKAIGDPRVNLAHPGITKIPTITELDRWDRAQDAHVLIAKKAVVWDPTTELFVTVYQAMSADIGIGTVGLEITPSQVKAQIGSEVIFTCKYKSMETLKITFLDNGMPVTGTLWESINQSSWYFIVKDCAKHRIQCIIQTVDGTIVGSVTSLVNPEGNVTTTTPGTWQSSTAPPVTMEITIYPPPNIQIYEVGSTVTFNCTARSLVGRRPIRVHWTKDGSALPTHASDDGYGMLVITNLRVSDSGRYVCEAYDGYSIETKDITVTVGPSQPEAPRVAISPSFVDVQVGQLIQIQCAASGNPQPDLRLIRLDGQQLNPAHIFQNGLFRIEHALKSDEGPYQCIAANAAGTDTSNVDIYVRDHEGGSVTVQISPQYHTGRAGENFSLRCQGNREGNIRWSRQNEQLPYNSVEDNGVLTVYSAKYEDSGVYICTITTSSGYTGTATAEVRIEESSQNVYPTAEVSPERITISQGASTELRCEAGGLPVPRIKWTKMNSEIPPHIEQIGSVLYIRNAQVSDRGVYVCVVSNSIGLAQASTIVEVNRVEAPIITIYPQGTLTLVKGNSAMLQCRAEAGIPSPTLTWSRSSGAPLSPNVERMSDGTLRFTDVTENESGEYVCTAENDAGRAQATANIVVQVGPQIWTVPNEYLITKVPDEYVRLECHATGSPAPTVQWHKHDERVLYSAARGDSGAERDVAILEIARFSSRDQGLYICVARNDVGTVEKRIELVLKSYPSRGDIVKIRQESIMKLIPMEIIDTTNVHIHLPLLRNHRSTVTTKDSQHQSALELNYVVKSTIMVVLIAGSREDFDCLFSERDEVFVTWTRTNNASLPSDAFIRGGTLYIDNVQPSAAGEYRCLGSHRRTGQVVFSVTAHLEVISPPRITLIPPRQIVRPGDNAHIECSATGQQPISIRWLPVGRSMPVSVTTNDGLIRFNNIQLSDAGRYRCTATNTAGQADAVADVIVEENIHKPTLTAENRQQQAPIGSSISLRCTTHSSSAASNIRWFRERLPLPENSRINGEYLHIFNVQSQDEGRYYCEISTEGGSSSDYIDLRVTKTNHRIGENVDISCHSTEPGVITTWSKVYGRLADNVHHSGGTLRIFSLRPENAGTYRCEATGSAGLYKKDYNLHIIDQHDVKDEAPLEVKRAPQGSTVILECKTDLEQPVSYFWTKQGSTLPNYVDVYSHSIQLNDITSSDAGIYICTQTKGQRKIETPTVLVVTGIVPHFTQAPTSYITLRTLPDAYLQFNFEVSFKPQNSDGLILYNGNKGNDRSGDFISLSLVNGVPEFRYMLGHAVTVVKADHPVSLNQWHTVKVIRHKKKVTMFVDGASPYVGTAEGKYISLDLSEPLYLGGVPNFNQISPEAGVYTGFVGCISRFKIGYTYHDITKDVIAKHGITTCETCSENRCENQDACGRGRCVDNEHGFDCLCPMGHAGRRCEREITVNEPAFSRNSYVTYPTPKVQRNFKVTLKLKPNDASDGILLYCGETDEGHGDFVSLAIKNRRIEFAYNVGGRPTVIQSAKEVRPGEWYILTASRSSSEGRLIVNGEIKSGSTSRNHKVLNLLTPLYVGGYDKQNVKIHDKVGVNTGFNGCISEIDVVGMNLNVVESVSDSANVEECNALNNEIDNDINDLQYAHENVPSSPQPTPYDSSRTGCTGNPCRNGGNCYPLSPTDYRCSCPEGFSGRNCEEFSPNLCEQYIPCYHSGTCSGNTTYYECSCVLGYTGKNCEQRIQLRNDAHFSGNGYLEFNRSLLDHSRVNEEEVIAFELSTNSSNGLIFWHGQTPNEPGEGQDYISLGIVNGYLEFSYDLGSGPVIIRNIHQRVDDGERHNVILKRKGKHGSIDIGNTFMASGDSSGLSDTLDCLGNIYLGGTPNVELMTASKFTRGFDGCIHGFELQNSNRFDLGTKAISGINVKPCSRIRWIPSSLIFTDSDQFDEIVEPPPVNIIHPKPSSMSHQRPCLDFYHIIYLSFE
ncbi:basement membrane-specific heparan sulfate proteoglycan core protein, partial [Asbolus verrucosus]